MQKTEKTIKTKRLIPKTMMVMRYSKKVRDVSKNTQKGESDT